MATYLLHGGGSRRDSKDNTAFFDFVTAARLNRPLRYLCVFFAREQAEWATLYAQHQKRINSLFPERKIEFKLADPDPEKLQQQIVWADSLFIRGGETFRLTTVLSRLPNLQELLADKIVGGSSAGAYVFCRYYYSIEKNKIGEGMGLLPCKIIAHYTDALINEKQTLDEYGERLPLYLIPEEKFEIVRV